MSTDKEEKNDIINILVKYYYDSTNNWIDYCTAMGVLWWKAMFYPYGSMSELLKHQQKS